MSQREAASPPSDADRRGRFDAQARLVAALRDGLDAGAGNERTTLLETHISYVLLSGAFAYKIKKCVDLGFVDYTTLERRRAFCEAELRLNRRLAPALYLAVVPITGAPHAPVLGGNGPALEYAVKMRAFPQHALLDEMLARGELGPERIDELAVLVAAFHRGIAVAAPDSRFGCPDRVLSPALTNFATVEPLEDDPHRITLRSLRAWTEATFSARRAAFDRRHSEGFIRECHGDLHLGNMALVDGKVTIFDGIEFNDELRWIDVLSEIAFAVMDLRDRGREDLAWRLLNGYLEATGDYAGVAVLPFYIVYRAMVRAKVAYLLHAQSRASPTSAEALARARHYVGLAEHCSRPGKPALLITHGLAGSGKSTLTQALSERVGAIRVRTDVERKRVHGLAAHSVSGATIDAGIYSAAATERTYVHVGALARAVVDAGYTAIVDGAFLKRWQREAMRRLAAQAGVPLLVLDFRARETTLRARVAARSGDRGDASEADLPVLEHQLVSREPLAGDELASTVVIDGELPLTQASLPAAWQTLLDALDAARRSGPQRAKG